MMQPIIPGFVRFIKDFLGWRLLHNAIRGFTCEEHQEMKCIYPSIFNKKKINTRSNLDVNLLYTCMFIDKPVNSIMIILYRLWAWSRDICVSCQPRFTGWAERFEGEYRGCIFNYRNTKPKDWIIMCTELYLFSFIVVKWLCGQHCSKCASAW